ncbi:conserved protein, unknown function [Hepatocystis sp. ex Piliocolobus tephrosceles]|nr:conserved protein, unknown function [Hepatocystis sp. ex Piliocolobus tephrosceles]
MALNPALVQGQGNFIKNSVYTYLRREHVNIKLYLPDRTIKESGTVFLTNLRLIFIKNVTSKTNPNFSSAELPLNLIEKPKFEQPVFGENHLTGIINPSINSPNSLRSACKWNLYFSNGQCTSFLHYFFKAYESVKHNKPLQSMNEMNSIFFANVNAYVDPSDPTYLYINEPIPETLYTVKNINQNQGIQPNKKNSEDIPVYQRPYIPQQNNNTYCNSNTSGMYYNNTPIPNNANTNNHMLYNQPNYNPNYSRAGNNDASLYNRQMYVPNNPQNYSYAPLLGHDNPNTNITSPNYNIGSDNNRPFCNKNDNNTYATMSNYNQHNNMLRCNNDHLTNRTVFNPNSTSNNAALDSRGYNSCPYKQQQQQQGVGMLSNNNQGVQPSSTQTSNQQYNPAYNGQLNNSSITQPNNQQYGQPNNQQYGQPNNQQYGQPNNQQNGQPSYQQYGQSNNQQYGQPNNQQYGQPNNQQNGQPSYQQYGQSNNQQ